jgi:CDP-4-dehydro-6-deoxyglucose reductase
MALLPWRIAKVIRIANHTPTTRQFWFEVAELDVVDFKPGQFVTLDLPIHEKPNKRWRSYSIASCPDQTNTFELLIVLAEGGAGTTYLFNEVVVGTEIPFRGPQGVFGLPSDLSIDTFLICTGTGIAPFRSMVRSLYENQTPIGNLHLVFGCRKKEDLLYYQELKELENKFSGFHYHPVLSRETWEGRMGYVHPVYEELCKAKQPAQFLLCGWKNMIDEALTRIQAMGYDKKQIHREIYG